MCLYSSEIVSVFCVIFTGFVSILIAYLNNKNYSKRKYEKRQEAVRDALSFLDSYCSWLTYNSGIEPVRGPITSKEDMTIEARKCYEQLCVSVKDGELIETYLNIIMGKEEAMRGFLKFRKLSRKELDLKEIQLNNNYVFLSSISTENLSLKN